MPLVTPPAVTRSPASTTRLSYTVTPALLEIGPGSLVGGRRAGADHAGPGQEQNAGADTGQEDAVAGGVPDERRPVAPFGLGPGPRLGPGDPAAARHEEDVGAGLVDRVGRQSEPVVPGHLQRLGAGHQPDHQVRAVRRRPPQHLQRTDGVELVDPVEQHDVDGGGHAVVQRATSSKYAPICATIRGLFGTESV